MKLYQVVRDFLRMFGDKALELVKELKRAMDGTLPPYNVRYCLLVVRQNWRENLRSELKTR